MSAMVRGAGPERIMAQVEALATAFGLFAGPVEGASPAPGDDALPFSEVRCVGPRLVVAAGEHMVFALVSRGSARVGQIRRVSPPSLVKHVGRAQLTKAWLVSDALPAHCRSKCRLGLTRRVGGRLCADTGVDVNIRTQLIALLHRCAPDAANIDEFAEQVRHVSLSDHAGSTVHSPLK